MNKLLFISLVVICIAPPAKGQFPNTDSLNRYVHKWVRNRPITEEELAIIKRREPDWITTEKRAAITVNSRGRILSVSDTTTSVMLKIVLLDRPSVHFYRQGYKRGEQYWYLDGKKIKKLPRNWFVFDYRVVK